MVLHGSQILCLPRKQEPARFWRPPLYRNIWHKLLIFLPMICLFCDPSFIWPKIRTFQKSSHVYYISSGVARIFSEGWRSGHLKAITPPPAGGPGAKAPAYGSEVSFFKTIQSIRKWIHFSKISTFFLPEKFIFLGKISENWAYLTKISEFFRKIILNFQFLWYPINSEKFPVNSII